MLSLDLNALAMLDRYFSPSSSDFMIFPFYFQMAVIAFIT